MAVTLLLVFRNRLRLLPLAIALAAAGITFGVLSVVGATLTMASIAVLPILIGLAVDYGDPVPGPGTGSAAERDRPGRRRGRPSRRPPAARCRRSRPPRSRPRRASSRCCCRRCRWSTGFGLLLVVGIAIALACALTPARPRLVLSERGGGVVGASLRGASEIVGSATAPVRRASAGSGRDRPRRRAARCRTSAALGMRPIAARDARNPGRVLASLPCWRWSAGSSARRRAVQSDVTKLVPSNMPALRNLRTLEKRDRRLGRDRRHRPRAERRDAEDRSSWMISYENTLLTHFGYVEEQGCAHATLCPALSLPDLFSTGQPVDAADQRSRRRRSIEPAEGGADLLLPGGDHA